MNTKKKKEKNNKQSRKEKIKNKKKKVWFALAVWCTWYNRSLGMLNEELWESCSDVF